MRTLLNLKNIESVEEESEQDIIDPVSFADIPETISWQAIRAVSEAAHHRRHIIIVAIAVFGSVIALWQSSWLTFLAIALALATWEIAERFVHSSKASLDQHGLVLDGRHYTHTELASFDIHRMPDEAFELSLKTRHWHIPHLRIPLGEQDPEEVYALLSQYVANERHPVPLLDYWLRK